MELHHPSKIDIKPERLIRRLSLFQGVNECSGNVVKANRRARTTVDRRVGDGLHGQSAGAGSNANGMPSRWQQGEAMKESFEQKGAYGPSLPIGSRQAAQSCGSATELRQRHGEREPEEGACRPHQAGRSARASFSGRETSRHALTFAFACAGRKDRRRRSLALPATGAAAGSAGAGWQQRFRDLARP
jgi:hypothetical protein